MNMGLALLAANFVSVRQKIERFLLKRESRTVSNLAIVLMPLTLRVPKEIMSWSLSIEGEERCGENLLLVAEGERKNSGEIER